MDLGCERWPPRKGVDRDRGIGLERTLLPKVLTRRNSLIDA